MDEELEVDELERRLKAALADEEEMESISALHAWFVRRYPTPASRLAYVRRKAAEWRRGSVRRERG